MSAGGESKWHFPSSQSKGRNNYFSVAVKTTPTRALNQTEDDMQPAMNKQSIHITNHDLTDCSQPTPGSCINSNRLA